jgi:hypothetical protein
MTKQKPLLKSETRPTISPTIGRAWCVAISMFVILHLLAVLAEPLRFFSQSPVKYAAEEARLLRTAIGPYVDLMYLSHGYSFFAPNPGPSHLLECELKPIPNSGNVTKSSGIGQPVVADASRANAQDSDWRVFPDRKVDWPRLLYHRYFMFSEFYQSQFAPVTLADRDQLDKNVLAQWQSDREQYEQLQASIRANLAQRYPARQATLRRIEHILPSEYQVLVDRWKLTDPRLYVELSEGGVPAIPAPAESLPKP